MLIIYYSIYMIDSQRALICCWRKKQLHQLNKNLHKTVRSEQRTLKALEFITGLMVYNPAYN